MISSAITTTACCLTLTILAWLSLCDIRSYRINVLWVIPILIQGLVVRSQLDEPSYLTGLIASLILLVLFAILSTIYHLIRNQKGIGEGDIILLTGLGLWFEPSQVPTLLTLIGLIGLIHMLVSQGIKMQAQMNPIPLIPSISIAACITFLTFTIFNYQDEFIGKLFQ